MESGTLVAWKEVGYGFVEPDHGGIDVFVHAQQLCGGTQSEPPRAGMRVEFEAI